MNAKVGMYAGDVWTALNQNGELDVKELKKAAKLKTEKDLYLALGWLLREDKLVVAEDDEGGAEVILLKRHTVRYITGGMQSPDETACRPFFFPLDCSSCVLFAIELESGLIHWHELHYLHVSRGQAQVHIHHFSTTHFQPLSSVCGNEVYAAGRWHIIFTCREA